MKLENMQENQYLWDEKNPKGYYNRSGIYKTKIELDFIKSYISNNSKTILDLGGGSGRFALPLLKSGFDITVVDLDPRAIELCKRRGIVKSYCCDLKNIDLKGYNVVLAIELFLVTPPQEVIKISYQKLTDEGLFIFVGTNKNSWRNKLHNLRKNKSTNYGELSIKEYENLVVQNGFEIIKIKGFNWMPFKVNSNNVLIPLFSAFESILRLDKWLNQSPWLLFACKKGKSVL
ncbi:MAG: methyltransferase domain-containing protein [Bacteroidota bacterium]